MQSPLIQVRVRRKSAEAIDIASFELVPLEPQTLPQYEPGAHIDVDVGGGEVRQYSLCTPYEENHYLIGVKRDPKSRGGSLFMHADLQEGDVLSIGSPRNHFPIAPEGQRFILLAGGIGITPLLCMAMQLIRTGKDVELHYFAQSTEHVAFRDRLQTSSLAPSVRYHLGHAPDELGTSSRPSRVRPLRRHICISAGHAHSWNSCDSRPRTGPSPMFDSSTSERTRHALKRRRPLAKRRSKSAPPLPALLFTCSPPRASCRRCAPMACISKPRARRAIAEPA